MAFVASTPLVSVSRRTAALARSASGTAGKQCVSAKLSLEKVAAAVVAAALVITPVADPAHASLFNFEAARPRDIGVRSERYLGGCPATPNCICSQENAYNSHYVPSWTYAEPIPGDARAPKTMNEAADEIVKAIEGYEKAFGEAGTIVERRETSSEVGKGIYIYAEFKTKLLGFVDDVEFLLSPDGKTVEYRSASRLGRDDLKANRKRIRNVRVTLQDMDKRWASTGY